MRGQTCYTGNDTNAGYYKVTFIVNDTRQKLTRSFDSEYKAYLFVNKLRHSKRCTLTSYPLFR